ncbi:hypothetical protein NEICINOT_04807 [Neisseria cinerea ATCC 14685]|uniref:Uncharacterized protein n=1 Tax=Neisseria cinerea ATCC 14685 TaxID=546262 RepID=D0W557_NEICI|nr:hypothetical protein NEICINOT_04807 [Neisseria cinerea ATCC 14685]
MVYLNLRFSGSADVFANHRKTQQGFPACCVFLFYNALSK